MNNRCSILESLGRTRSTAGAYCVAIGSVSRFFRLTLMALALFAGRISVAADLPSQWTEIRRLAAPEAVQAAASDDRHVYAIANSVIAKYDRQTGKRLASSTGEASHLNAGFLMDGKLYCAHSNYPQQPEHSEIKIFDPESMTLAAFKDFGASDGSLTWAVFDQGSWWCNFAYYGEDNSKTYLARFDGDWREIQRWTYPADALKAFDKHSASCGIWRDERLLVTGHDKREIYVLEAPEGETELRYVATLPAPFTGQGFAADPATGGLVGIDRARRQIVFAR